MILSRTISFTLLITISFFLSIGVDAQVRYSKPNVIPPSPVAGELAKYITYPTDLSNGLVKISIPLYEVVDGDIKIPITLNYHASGLKANIRSNSWLGDGWSLNTGPSLSRNINGGADERFYFYDIIANTQPTYEQLELVVNQIKDVTLDEFHYSLLDNSGRLYFKRLANDQLRPVTIPVEPIKISLPVANNYNDFINITDTKGFQYSFGGTDNKFKDLMMNQYGESRFNVPTAWKINNIYSPLTNRTVSFDYSNNITEMPYYRKTDAVTMLDEFSCQCLLDMPAIQVSKGNQGSQYYNYNTTTDQLELKDYLNLALPPEYTFPMQGVDMMVQDNSYIKKISFTGGYVLFNKNEEGRAGLTSIRVYDNTNTLVKQIEFIQSASGSQAVLTLNEIKVSSPTSTEIERYNFLYNGVFLGKDTRSIDKWGYYNAADNTTLVPTIITQAIKTFFPFCHNRPVSINIPGGDREPNETAMKIGVLSGIIYPTGGRTNFIYEAHRYLDNLSVVKLAGGLRIKQIQDVNVSGDVVYKNYNYSMFGNSINDAGILNVIPMGNMNPSDDNFLYYTETQCFQFDAQRPLLFLDSYFKERRWSDNSMVNLFSENGSSVSYPVVVETTSSDAAGTLVLGKNTHTFNVNSSYPLKHGNTNIVTDSKDSWSKGKLISTTTFKNHENSQIDTVSQKKLSYSLGVGDEDDKIKQGYVYKSTRVYGFEERLVPEEYKKIEYVWNNLSTGRLLPSKEYEDTYGSSGRVEGTTSFDYDSYGNVSQTTKNTSTSATEKNITTNTYAKDMVNQGRDPLGTYANMVNANIVGVPVEVKTYKDNVLEANLLTTNTSNYSKINNSFFAPKEIISKVKSAINERKTLLNNYDSYGNLLEVKHLNGPKSVYLWGYNGQYPVAKIENATYAEVLTALGGGATATNILNSLNLATVSDLTIKAHIQMLRANLSKAQVSTYTYKPLVGMTSMTDPRGITETYQYDGLQRLKGVLDFEGNMRKYYQYHYRPDRELW